MMADDRSDREQISDVLIRYATGIDTKNWPLFRSCFTDDVCADYGDIGAWNTIDGITEYMTVTHQDMPDTLHMITNIAIELDGDHASAVSYVHAVLVVSDDPPSWVDAVGHYSDDFVRTHDGWRIRERTFVMTRVLMPDPQS
jgi:3-phenylpropionate/cinnamic acid dioxygenase small subunit